MPIIILLYFFLIPSLSLAQTDKQEIWENQNIFTTQEVDGGSLTIVLDFDPKTKKFHGSFKGSGTFESCRGNIKDSISTIYDNPLYGKIRGEGGAFGWVTFEKRHTKFLLKTKRLNWFCSSLSGKFDIPNNFILMKQ